jgi:hypothetical protein
MHLADHPSYIHTLKAQWAQNHTLGFKKHGWMLQICMVHCICCPHVTPSGALSVLSPQTKFHNVLHILQTKSLQNDRVTEGAAAFAGQLLCWLLFDLLKVPGIPPVSICWMETKAGA